jgi:xanthine dehydrogenase accessory factor
MDARQIAQIANAMANGGGCVRAIRLDTGDDRLILATDADDPLSALAHAALRSGKSQSHEIAGVRWFFQVFLPPIHLVIAGASHIAQPLGRMAAELGWRVTIVDPRTGWANPERFPGITLATAWPDEAMARLGLTARCCVVTLTHDPKLDDPALIAALRSPSFYIGALGSQKTHAARRERLRAQGFTDADLGRIHGPVGLAIGASSPSEIAISILAQIIACANGRKP